MRPAAEDMLMMRPRLALSIGRAMARVIQNGPDRFVSITASHSSPSMRISRLSRVIPALLTRMSTDPSAVERGLHDRLGRLAAGGGVALDRERPTPEAGDLGGDLLGGVGVAAVVDRDVGALPREGERDRAAQAAAAAGDERGLAGQVEHQTPARSRVRCGWPIRVCSPGARKARAGSAVHSTTAPPAV